MTHAPVDPGRGRSLCEGGARRVGGRPDELVVRLRSAGVAQAESFIELIGQFPPLVDWCELLIRCADPMEAALQWARLFEAAPGVCEEWADSVEILCERVTAVFSVSRALGDYLVAQPGWIAPMWVFAPDFSSAGGGADDGGDVDGEAFRAWVRAAFDAACAAGGVRGDGAAVPGGGEPVGASELVQALRRTYRQVLLSIVAWDARQDDAAAAFRQVGLLMSVVVDEALRAALRIARLLEPQAAHARMSVIAMGKTGAQELNYISDVDVIYVAATSEDVGAATTLATQMAHILSALDPQVSEEPLWALDTALRPEGKDGALVRTLDSYGAYWDKWAQTWEFQALLKARPCAGDELLGQEFVVRAAQYVWNASGRVGFVDSAREMRKRVEKSVPAKDAARELKLGRGGLRDVEFSIQMLQLVHGRHDPSVRERNTVAAIDALCRGGYVGREDATELIAHYCFLRAVEHRTQLLRMRRTHVLPAHARQLRSVARSLGLENEKELEQRLQHTRDRVRALHDDMFYRPIVAATAMLAPDSFRITRLSSEPHLHGPAQPRSDQGGLNEEAAAARLTAIGYLDTRAALGHIRALTAGMTRRAQIQRLLLPVFLDWLADGIDPDQGLLNFRTLSESIGETHWYLGLLRDSRTAARRLIEALSSSRWIAASVELRPEVIQWLDNDEELAGVDPQRLHREIAALVDRRPDANEAVERIRAVRARELTRAALADSAFGVAGVRAAIAQATDAALGGALMIAQRCDQDEHGYCVDVAYIAMGRYGGEESSYASDADVIAVHRPAPGVDPTQAAQAATRIVTHVQRLLGHTSAHAGISVDMDLRPEGKNGPMTKTVEGYQEYYERWALTWERQALLRARFAAGDSSVGEQYIEVIDPVRYGSSLTEAQLQEIRLLKARMERERLPRGIEAQRHVKLGPGGLSDVEWVVQMLQMRHAQDIPGLRTPSTLRALGAAVDAKILTPADGHALESAWMLASRIRAGNVLVTGRMSGQKLDVLGRNYREFAPLARLLGFARGREDELEQEWLRVSRQARAVMDRVFWT